MNPRILHPGQSELEAEGVGKAAMARLAVAVEVVPFFAPALTRQVMGVD